MSVTQQPSPIKAIVELLRGNATRQTATTAALVAELQTLVTTRIDTRWQDAWNKTNGRIYNAISVEGDGGIGVQGSAGVLDRAQGRVMIRCWSAEWHVANDIASLVSLILCPIDPNAGSSFIAANTYIEAFTGISDPLRYIEPGTEYQRAMALIANCWYLREPWELEAA